MHAACSLSQGGGIAYSSALSLRRLRGRQSHGASTGPCHMTFRGSSSNLSLDWQFYLVATRSLGSGIGAPVDADLRREAAGDVA